MKNKETVAFLGIGGGAVSYTAKYYHFLGYDVLGYDIQENETIRELKALNNVEISLRNPEGPFHKDVKSIIYSAGIPPKILDPIRSANLDKEFIEVGEFFAYLTARFENNELNSKELEAFKESKIAPLYTLDYSKEKYIGVTGTDGKTTTCSMLFHILKSLGHKPGMITTISALIGDKRLDTGLHQTTPSAQEIYTLIKQMKEEGCTHIIIESTSHGLSMGRLAGVRFDVAVFTNVTEEHLDYHKTWENYAMAKALLFTKHLKSNGAIVLNEDDIRSYRFLKPLIKRPEDVLSYSLENRQILEDTSGLNFIYKNQTFRIPVLGKYNVSNALAALKCCEALGIDAVKAAKTLENFETVEGRMNVLQKTPFTVIVDFAHTPNALKEALESVRKLKSSEDNKIILVFGCAGQRDPSKRLPMGRYAKEYADTTILTAEDPRTEELKKINDQIEKGWNSISNIGKSLHRFDDSSRNVDVRREAIKKALNLGQEGDVVLITGKGHENSLCFNNTEYEWNDIAETNKLLKML